MLYSLINRANKKQIKLNADRAVKSKLCCVRCIVRKGFTLLELLLVIAIIGSLAAIILVILKPADRIAKANNSKRKADVDAIKYAIDTYGLDNGGTEYDLTICTNTICEVCGSMDSGVCTTANKLYLGGLLGGYLNEIPLDPRESNRGENGTGYYVSKTGTNVRVIALGAELGQSISTDGIFRQGVVAASSFTPNISKRNSAGPFASGIMLQGDLANLNGDMLTIPSGNQISGNFYQNIDTNQGSVVFWITPEWNGNDNLEHYILNDQSNGSRLVKTTSNNLDFHLPNSTNVFSKSVSDWIAGNTYNVVVRWDTKNSIDGTNYAAISINDVHTFYKNTSWGSPSSAGFYFGSALTYREADAIIEGLTIYRRPLYDGQYGINIGLGDEIAQIYNTGTGKDPTLVTGSWDVVLAIPTNASIGTIASGNGNAWSHPHLSNLLYTNTTNTGGFMINGTYGSDGWISEGTPVSVGPLVNSEKIFPGGYKVTSDAINEGIYYEKAVTAGQDFVIRAIVNSDGVGIPKIILYDQTSGQEIGNITGTNSSTRTSPDQLIFTGEAPDGKARAWVSVTGQPLDGQTVTIGSVIYTFKSDISATPAAGEIWVLIGATYTNTADNLRRAIVNAGTLNTNYKYGTGTAAHGIVTASIYLGDVTLTALASGSGGNIALAESADNVSVSAANLSGGKTATTTIRVKLINTQASGTLYWHQVELLNNRVTNPSIESGTGNPWLPVGWTTNYVANESFEESTIKYSGNKALRSVNVGGFRSANFGATGSGGNFNMIGWMGYRTGGCYHNNSNQQHAGSGYAEIWWTSGASLYRHMYVVRGGPSNSIARSSCNSGTAITDDVYTFALSDVSLTVTSATLANSTESSGLRIDGKDTYTKAIEQIMNVKGSFEFDITPRHSFSTADRYGFTKPVIAHLYIDANNNIKLYKENATVLRLTGVWSGVSVNGDWTNPTLNAGTKYNMEIIYESSTSMKLMVDGVERINAALSGKKFGVNPSGLLYIGSDNTGSNQYDLTVDTNTIQFRLI